MRAAKKPSMREIAEATILDRLRSNVAINVLDSEFVDEFVDAVGCEWQALAWGAGRCRYLSRTLKRMTDAGILRRSPYGLPHGNWQPGFPKWVYMYWLNDPAPDKRSNDDKT